MKCKYINNLLLTLVLFIGVGCNNDLDKSVIKTDEKVYDTIGSIANSNSYDIPEIALVEDPNFYELADVSNFLSPEGELSLINAVSIASQYNREYSYQKEQLYLVALNQTDVEHLYEPIPFANANVGQRKDGSNEAFGSTGNIGFSQLLSTGARVGTNLSIGWLDILSGDFRSGLSGLASAVISQPLLRGAGRKVALENLTQSQRNTLYQIRNFNRFRKVFFASVITDYYSVLILQDKANNALDHFNKLKDTYSKLKRRSLVGKVSKHQFEQIAQDLLKAESQYIQRQQTYEDMLDELKLKLAISPEQSFQLDMNELAVLKDVIKQQCSISENQAIDIALDQRLDLANFSDMVLDASRKVDVAADAIRSELNLVGYVQSYDDKQDRGIFGANPGQINQTQGQYELSLQLNLPLDRVLEKNAYRRSLVNLLRMQRDHIGLTDRVIVEARRAYQRMQESQSRYSVDRSGVDIAAKRAENSIVLLQYNRASTRDMLDAYDDLLDSKDAVSEALIDYITASLEFYRDTGVLKLKPDGNWDVDIPEKYSVTMSN